MDERARRVGRNEAVFREVNERIEDLDRGIAQISDGKLHIVCECGDLLCSEPIAVAIPAYEEIRSDSALFFVRPGHEKPDVEETVASVDGYQVVRKRTGEPEQIARETDPRRPST